MEFLNRALRSLPAYEHLRQAVERGYVPVSATGLSGVHKANLICTLPADLHRRALVVAPDEGAAVKMTELLAQMGADPLLFPARDLCLRPVESVSREFERNRIGVLSRLMQEQSRIVVATPDALLLHTMPPAVLQQLVLRIDLSENLTPEHLVQTLIAGGYAHTDSVEGEGQFARRGGIVDVFVPGMQQPARVEFWGDEIDSIALFDPVTQRRTDKADSLTVTPAREVLYTDRAAFCHRLQQLADRLKPAEQAAKQHLYADLDQIKNGLLLPDLDRYILLCYDRPATLLDYLGDAMVFVDEQNHTDERLRGFEQRHAGELTALLEEGRLCKALVGSFCMGRTPFYNWLQQADAVLLETFAVRSGAVSPKDAVTFDLKTIPAWNGLIEELQTDLAPYLHEQYRVVILGGSQRASITLADSLQAAGLPAIYGEQVDTPPAGGIVVTPGGLPMGIEYTGVKIAVFTHARAAQPKKRRKYGMQGAAIGSLEELHRGDYVVHSVYGIGVFDGINKIENNGIIKDYIKIRYQRDDILYVPVTQLDLVSRYIGAPESGAALKLDKLGSDRWLKTKARVKSAVKDMAKELIALYAKRASAKGFAFSPDTDLQHDFEYRFPYEETDDQLKCCDEIKGDMERPMPMDRLLCGDVGFGKTEVALRAAFKCVCDGKQCAILVPTTILAMQHYKTLLQRMEGFPVQIEMLSRFKTPAQQTAIRQKLRRGEIDIIVGTHRLISKDIQFADLGLLVVDEEQRFGVAQKEKLKQLFPTVDVLTLSATPIPRTLNMAMSGLRDMSVIEEAPQDRYPVQSYVLEYDRSVLYDAIRRELFRGGQVYYIHNRVDTISRIAARIQEDIPEARVAVAHGQMDEHALSEIWRGVIDGEINVLVCTTIIETGVDVSNVNTLIIEDADRFGLSQLHQLRGRVGRSPRRAYAYFTFRRGKALSEVSEKRLEAIREFTEFGAGFKIAMRDLEIRGAGNVLGARQHGHMESVGYDMYLKLLSDAVKEEKGEPVTDAPDCTVDLQMAAHIPEDYIPALPERLHIYRRIAQIKTQEQSEDVLDELIDRYGEPPASVLGLIDIAFVRNRAAAAGIAEVAQKGGCMLLYPVKFDLQKASALVSALKGRVMLSGGERPYISVRFKSDGQLPTDLLQEILDAYCK